MIETNDILVVLQYRGHFSVGSDRQLLKHAAFHWSIGIRSTSALHKFDVTDGIILDPDTKENLNREEKWVYRHIESTTTTDIARYLGAIRIGKLKDGHTISEAHALFEKIPLPIKESDPVQNCVTWAVNAIRVLQDAGFLEQFEVPVLMDRALMHGDDRILDLQKTREVVSFPQQKRFRKGTFSMFKKR